MLKGDNIADFILSPNQITPSERLSYTPCFEDYQCSRLEVPLDWNSTLDKEEKVALAIIKIPAQVPITDPSEGETRSFHKDSFHLSADNPIQNPSPSDGLYYDIIGYDPRGFNNTTPRYECFSELYSRQRWSLDNNLLDLLGSSDVATEKAWARAMTLAATCTHDGGPRIGQLMNTTPNVADIVEILERLGEWREQETDEVLAHQQMISESEKQRVRDANRWQEGEELLQFWGFSYGTVVGATFAAIQPHRVKRLVLDGVCDAEIMYSGYWTTNILDTDKIMTNFFESCQQAGPTQCSFAADGSSKDLEATLDRTLESLNRILLVVPGSNARGPDIITYSDILRYIKKSVYEPLEYFQTLADIFTGLSLGNGSVLTDIKNAEKISIHPIDDGQSSLTSGPPYEEIILEVLASIACTDGEDHSTLGKEDFLDYYEVLKKQSKWMADIWAAFTMSCWGWKTRPKWRYEGITTIGRLS
ncbi:hypothetical protein N7528_009338 [Penicillium herquei]|nr:hypothetical protein N7528_009338 [Penicillium herquei]